MSMPGIPGLYFHSLVGSQNDRAAVERSGDYRAINREKLAAARLRRELEDKANHRFDIFNRLKVMLKRRRHFPAFHPQSGFKVHRFHPDLFVLERGTHLAPGQQLLCLHNFGPKKLAWSKAWGRRFNAQVFAPHHFSRDIAPYSFNWFYLKRGGQ